MIRLLIADDHPVVREGLRRVVESAAFQVVGEATNGDDLLARAAEVQADVVLLDITMPGPGFVEVIQRLRLLRPNLRVLVLSVQPEDQFGLRVLQAGAAGYLSKNQSPEQLVAAIRRVVGGGRYVSPALAEQLASVVAKGDNRRPHELLSAREYQVLCLIGAGKSVKEVAAAMSLSPKTVSTYRTRVLEKLKLHSTADLVRFAIRNQLA